MKVRSVKKVGSVIFFCHSGLCNVDSTQSSH